MEESDTLIWQTFQQITCMKILHQDMGAYVSTICSFDDGFMIEQVHWDSLCTARHAGSLMAQRFITEWINQDTATGKCKNGINAYIFIAHAMQQKLNIRYIPT
jgi:hypothetical protein